MNNNTKTNFGKRKVSPYLKTKLVQNIFTNVAKKYDIMNDLMSFGTHRVWKKELIDLINIQPLDKIKDVGSGTGDLIALIDKKRLNNSIYSIDLNLEMLKFGKKKFFNKKIKFIKANAEKLPFKDNTFDKYIISFCLRNVTNYKEALKESLRVIKPGGVFYCMEFSSPELNVLKLIYDQYKKNYIPWIGKIIANNLDAYKYLDESIDFFPDQKNLLKIINETGYVNTKYINLFNGIVAVHSGYKV